MTKHPQLYRRLEVLTCIACGARTRIAECPHGCEDVPLDLVDAHSVDALTSRCAELRAAVAALRAVLEDVLDADADALAGLRASAHAALLAHPVPPAVKEPTLIEAWGCPRCGRVDAPQPCLDVCIRRPVEMADVAELRQAAHADTEAEAQDRKLRDAVRMVAHITPRTGREDDALEHLARRARAALRD